MFDDQRSAPNFVLGVDVGSVSAAIVAVGESGIVLHEDYALHHGNVRDTLRRILSSVDLTHLRAVAATHSAAPFVAATRTLDAIVASVSAARHLHTHLDALLIVGGEKFHLVRFSSDGRYLETRGSSPCAAGTGSFLDQQARRLGLADSAAISTTALSAHGQSPKIASRCSVFAKTDLIHAQQQGYSLEAICDGLCHGLAANVVDTLWGGQTAASGRIVFAGGVSRNQAVRRHLESLIEQPLIVDDRSHLYGALGAALLLSEHLASCADPKAPSPSSVDELLRVAAKGMQYAHPPLELIDSRYPDFSDGEHSLFEPERVRGAAAVEVDVCRPLKPGDSLRALLGIDIGSTSTKAVLLDADVRTRDERVIAGFYTRTCGQPLTATQGLFEAIDALARDRRVELEIIGVTTTGSGRKLVGAIVGADEVVDEITAHARAAYELDPEVDTIIEIGGQDAKFTTLREGRVTLSIMNNVCAAGTGSFIEEQANRLGCPLSECAARTSGKRAPLTSDCCTVFMERDINHHLASGYELDEVLAASLHAVCENYLQKVARQSAIGRKVCFQGATAKNRSLVAAFEQRLGKPVFVSRHCHLTGALGAALLLAEQPRRKSTFRGLGLFREQIEVDDEVCTLCKNHCKLKIGTVRGSRVAYGMLCGRDYDVDRFVSANKSGFDLLRALRAHHPRMQFAKRFSVTLGLPATLAIYEDLPMWQRFFDILGVPTVTSEHVKDVVTTGKRLAGAEFCAPIAAFHGHVASLAEKSDFVFVPFYLEDDRTGKARRNYCYYTQFAGSLAATMTDETIRAKLLTPVIRNGESHAVRVARLFDALAPALGPGLRRLHVARAYLQAVLYARDRAAALPDIMRKARAQSPNDLSVVLLGRPYAVLAPSMNKSIPELFAALGVRCFAQSMLEVDDEHTAAIEGLLASTHWAYSAKTLVAAEKIAKTPGLYPVIVTSFKCAPDSCSLESVRRILDRSGKPYLVLQLDEHDSRVGYETRIEAALRSFRNHHAQASRPNHCRSGASPSLPVNPQRLASIRDRTILLPVWDRYACAMMAANFRREGIDARVLDEDPTLITQALQHNSGQCIPLNVIVQDFIAYVRKHDIDPARAAVWIHSSQMGCNIGAFPRGMQQLLDAHGGGFEHSRVYVGQMTGKDISARAIVNQYRVFLCAGYLRRMGCRIRPYEVVPGQTDAVLEEAFVRLTRAFEDGQDIVEVVRSVVDRFTAIPTRQGQRPKIALFGDMYVRDNDVFNQHVIARIEAEGGEVVTTPYTEYTQLIADAYLRKWVREGKYKQAAEGRMVLATAKILEKDLLREFARVLGPPTPIKKTNLATALMPYRVTIQHTGESFDNLLKIHHLIDAHPDIALFVQLSPAFCCPSLVTQAMTREIRRRSGVPIVTITYDGTQAPKNDVIAPYLHFLRTGDGQRKYELNYACNDRKRGGVR